MAKMVRKADLPRKDCAACAREMVWRRKWSDDWDEVRYCSHRCRRAAKAGRAAANSSESTANW